MMSLTGIRGLSEPTGSWKMICIRRRSFLRSSPALAEDRLAVELGRPGGRRLAAGGASCPRVVLPQPDSPTRPKISPRADVEADVVDRLDVADVAAQEAADDRVVLDEVRRSRRAGVVGASGRGLPPRAAVDRGLGRRRRAGRGAASRSPGSRQRLDEVEAAVGSAAGSASPAPGCTASSATSGAVRRRRSAGRSGGMARRRTGSAARTCSRSAC